MTTKQEWWDRAQHLRFAAARLYDKASALKAEADGLKEIAAACEEEGHRVLRAEKQQHQD